MFRGSHVTTGLLLVIAVALVGLLGLVAYNTFVNKASAPALDSALAAGGGAAGSEGDVIAVPVQYSPSEEVLVLIHKGTVRRGANEAQEWVMAGYQFDRSGPNNRRLAKLAFIRNLEYDLNGRDVATGLQESRNDDLHPEKLRESRSKPE